LVLDLRHSKEMRRNMPRCNLVGKPKKGSLLCGPRHYWEDNVKRDFKEMSNGVEWNYLAQNWV
jgi:hypothetical protein